MSLSVSAGKNNYEPVEAGNHHAIAIWVADLGNQYNQFYNNTQPKLLIAWEIPEQRIDIEKDGETVSMPRVISKIYTASLNAKSNLFKDLSSFRGKQFTAEELEAFDVSNIIGANCLLNIIHKETDKGTFANINGITPLAKGMKKLKPETHTIIYDMDKGGDVPAELPEWIRNKIAESQEMRENEIDQAVINTPTKGPTGERVNDPTTEKDATLPF